MAIRGDSYSSADDVLTWTRHLIEGQTTFNSTTRPTLTEVEGFIDESSSLLNLGFLGEGFEPSNVKANSTAKLACDNWVRGQASSFVEITRPFQGLNSNQNRSEFMQKMAKDAREFAENVSLPLQNMGVAESYPEANGIYFTGEDAQSQRSDPDNEALEQPFAKRNQFDNTRSPDSEDLNDV